MAKRTFFIQVHSLSPWSAPILTLLPNEYVLKLVKFNEGRRVWVEMEEGIKGINANEKNTIKKKKERHGIEWDRPEWTLPCVLIPHPALRCLGHK